MRGSPPAARCSPLSCSWPPAPCAGAPQGHNLGVDVVELGGVHHRGGRQQPQTVYLRRQLALGLPGMGTLHSPRYNAASHSIQCPPDCTTVLAEVGLAVLDPAQEAQRLLAGALQLQEVAVSGRAQLVLQRQLSLEILRPLNSLRAWRELRINCGEHQGLAPPEPVAPPTCW